MKYDKQKMIDKLERAKDIVSKVHDITELYECGTILCDIDEAIGIIAEVN